MRILNALAVTVGVAMLVPATGSAQCDNLREAHFSGHNAHASASGTFVVGEAFTAYQTMNDVQGETWYPFNQGAFEYTLVISGNVTSYLNIPIGGGLFLRQVSFGNTTFAIYEDAATAADYGNVGTFTDGTTLLTGVITGMVAEGVVDGLTPEVLGITGDVSITGGVGLPDILCNGLTMNDFLAWLPATSPPGFKEAYDSKWECCPTDVDATTWGGVKSLYR